MQVLVMFLVGCADGFSLEDMAEIDIESGEETGKKTEEPVRETEEPVTGLWTGDCLLVAEDPDDLIPLIVATLDLQDNDGVLTGTARLETFDDEGRAEEVIEGTFEGIHEGSSVVLAVLSEDLSDTDLTLDLVEADGRLEGRLDASVLGEGPDAPHYDCLLAQQ